MYQKKKLPGTNILGMILVFQHVAYIYLNDFDIYQNKSGHGILIMSLEIRKHTNIILPKTKIKGKFLVLFVLWGFYLGTSPLPMSDD